MKQRFDKATSSALSTALGKKSQACSGTRNRQGIFSLFRLNRSGNFSCASDLLCLESHGEAQVLDKVLIRLVPLVVALQPQEIRGMHGHKPVPAAAQI